MLTLDNMATAMKRKNESNDQESRCKKAANSLDKHVENRPPHKLSHFISWCKENDFQLSSKLRVGRDGSCAQYGMHATEDIAEGYCLFQVPRSVLLTPTNSHIAGLVDAESSKLTATNQWVPLLLTLLHECSKSDSKWRPYLDIAPDPEAIDLPMFWEKSDVDRFLKGTGVDLAVERDLKMIQADFENLVLPFTQRNEGEIRSEAINLDNFKRMVAFVMAYSFTEPAGRQKKSSKAETGSAPCDSEEELEEEEEEEDDDDEESGSERMLPPVMAPMADALNHITNNNAKLTFGTHALKMVTTRVVKKGEEIYNTYGEVSNLHLMHMYGFAEPYPDNSNDVVEIPVHRLLEAASERCSEEKAELELLDTKWKMLMEQDIISEDDVFVLGRDGVINDDICSQVLKVLCMSPSQYSEYVENEGWSDAGSEASDAEDNMLDISKLSQLSKPQKLLLKRMGELHLQNYAVSYEVCVKKMEIASTLPARERYALYTAHGQQMLINQLITACSS